MELWKPQMLEGKATRQLQLLMGHIISKLIVTVAERKCKTQQHGCCRCIPRIFSQAPACTIVLICFFHLLCLIVN